MIIPPTGSSENVNGNTIAMVVSGPMPGNTPMTVPSKQPTRHSNRFFTDSATPKPIQMLPNSWAMRCEPSARTSISKHRWPQRDGNLQPYDENTDISDNKDQHQ